MAVFPNQDFTYASAMRVSDPVEHWVVAFGLSHEAETRFEEYTQTHVGGYLVVAMDGVIISSPVINGPIAGGRGQVEGSFDQHSAELFATLLNTEPLPFTFVQVEQ